MTEAGLLFLPFWIIAIMCIHSINTMNAKQKFLLTKKDINFSIILTIILILIFYFYNTPEARVKRAYSCLYENSVQYEFLYPEGIDADLKRFKPSFGDL